GGYEAMAATMRAEGITVSTVAVGQGADGALLQRIAASGGGSFYQANDPATLPRIFTQDAMTHLGRLVREETFIPQQVERHPMLRGFDPGSLPPLLGYVKTRRRLTAQTPLVTDLDDPLLAHWRFGMGKVTAFTSDSKSRWAALWLANWPEGYSQFWAQVTREVARPPQGREMDLRIDEQRDAAWLEVDLLEDAPTFAHGARVEAEVHFIPQGAAAGALDAYASVRLDQVGPGRYRGRF